MEQHKHTHIKEMLLRYYNENLNSEEEKEVKEWINASEENKKTAQRIFTLSLAIDTRRMRGIVNTEKSLRQIKGRMIVQKQEFNWWEWTKRIAVILFIPLVSLLILQHYQKSPEQLAHMIEIRTNPGMVTKLTLPDGTFVSLNSESTLKYPSHFTEETREVQLSGEAYFEVTKDPTHRFVVSTSHQSQIEVLGTHFNVEAYDKDNFVATTLTEGKINFTYQKSGKRHILLESGHKLIYNNTTKKVSMYQTTGISEVSWKDGKIVFKDTPLNEALRILEKSFNVKFIIKNQQFNKDSFTGTFKAQRLEKILEYFKVSSKIRWRYVNNLNKDNEKQQIEIF